MFDVTRLFSYKNPWMLICGMFSDSKNEPLELSMKTRKKQKKARYPVLYVVYPPMIKPGLIRSINPNKSMIKPPTNLMMLIVFLSTCFPLKEALNTVTMTRSGSM